MNAARKIRPIVWALTMGRGDQAFLDAAWVEFALALAPPSLQAPAASWLLSLSPHYFTRPRDGRSARQYARDECRRIAASRQVLFERVLAPIVTPEAVVVDYGCGPGFLAAAVAPHVARVVAVDISSGTLACARVLNGAPNIDYRPADSEAIRNIPPASVDVVYSIAVAQHVTDAELTRILAWCARALRTGGRLVCHVQLEDPQWRSERAWREDRSISGRLKYRYGLHGYARTGRAVDRLVRDAGFAVATLLPMSSLARQADDDDVWRQHVVLAEKT